MGNQSSTSSSSASSSQIDIDRLRPFSRGSLGLSRSELDKRCQPSGLYAGCDWEKNAIRRLIADGRIAARQKGLESPDKSSGATEECPICFLYYSDVNRTSCCNACMCTECYLQVRPQKEKQSTCPFCNCDDFSVVMDKKKTESVCPSETSTSLSDSSKCSSASSSNGKKKSAASVAPHTPPQTPPHTPKATRKTSGFGSELEKDERYKRLRKRSESFASSDGTSTPKKEQEIIQSIAMTEEERQRLEDEMKAQHHHPLVLRLENEAQERRLENDRAYQNSSRSQSSRNPHLSRRVRAARNWEQLANFFDHGDEMDEVSALESAILYSRLAEASAQRGESRGSGTANDESNNRNNNGDEQLEGFPLLRTLLTGQIDSNQGSSSSGRNFRSSRRQRHPFIRSGLGSRSRGMGDVAMGTASLMMRGISEEEQINMAIAASMRDQEQQTAETNENENDESENDEADETAEADSSNSEQSSTDGGDNAELSPAVEEQQPPALKHQGSRDEESTITELARVVTDSRSPDADTVVNSIAA